MLFVQVVAFFVAVVAIAIAMPAPGASQGSPGYGLSAIHTMIHQQRSRSLNFSRSAPTTTAQILATFLAAGRPSKSELVDGASVILSRGNNADQPLSTTVRSAKTLNAKVKRVRPELAGAYSSKVLMAATSEDEVRLRSLSTEAREGQRDGGGVRARRAPELTLLLTPVKSGGSAREQTDGLRHGKNLSSPASRAGLTLDPCVSSSDCAGVRVCSFFAGDIETCNERTGCLCSPASAQLCISSVDCVAGETCVPGDDSSLCVSASATASTETPRVTGGSSGSEGKSSYNSVSTVRDGLSFAACFEESDCKSPRRCYAVGSLDPCDGTTLCFCNIIPPDECSPSDPCFEGEVCLLTSDNIGPWCVSPAVAATLVEDGGTIIVDGSESAGHSEGDFENKPPPTDLEDEPPATGPGGEPVEDSDEDGEQSQASVFPGDVGLNIEPEDDSSDEGVCVDAKALAHMPTSDLVFERHPRARVLCDVQSSCATPGHMVVFRGEAMMMKSYCKLTSCSKRVMEVNSPRYRRQLLVSSNTDELKFTVFAARYETRGEETLMSMAVRIGW